MLARQEPGQLLFEDEAEPQQGRTEVFMVLPLGERLRELLLRDEVLGDEQLAQALARSGREVQPVSPSNDFATLGRSSTSSSRSTSRIFPLPTRSGPASIST